MHIYAWLRPFVFHLKLSQHCFFFFFLKVYSFWLRCCEPAFSSCNKWGLFFVVVLGLLNTGTLLVSVHRLWSAGSVVVVHELSCSEACGIFPE